MIDTFSSIQACLTSMINVQVSSISNNQVTLVRNYDPPTDSLTGVRCRATSIAKKETSEMVKKPNVNTIRMLPWAEQ